MAKKNVIQVEYDFSFELWGIVSTMRDYQICWELNKALGIKLTRLEDIGVANPQKGKQSYYSLFRYFDEMDKCSYHLISNKYINEFLVPEVKEADYFLRLTGEVPEEYCQMVFNKLKAAPKIMAVIKLNAEKLKSKHNLIVE